MHICYCSTCRRMHEDSHNRERDRCPPRWRAEGGNARRAALSCLLGCLLLLGAVRTLRAQTQVYIVQPGDTLSEIAKSAGTTTAALRSLNNLADADFVWAGQRLLLPEDAALAGDQPYESAVAAPEGTTTYTVRVGDSLTGIAAAHRTGVAQLVTLNGISPAQRLTPGQTLIVPIVERADTQPLPRLTEERVHVVQAGENIGVIADRYGLSPVSLASANQLTDAGLIVPGQRLVIPAPSFAELAADAPLDVDGFPIYAVFPVTTTERWIDVDLSDQRVVAFEGRQPVRRFVVSTGKAGTPTVKGTFRIWIKTAQQDMFGGNRADGGEGYEYYIPDVKWVQYFYQDYAFHGAYWRKEFGEPGSRGCINMSDEDAKWLFDWGGPAWNLQGDDWQRPTEENPGTLVVVHD